MPDETRPMESIGAHPGDTGQGAADANDLDPSAPLPGSAWAAEWSAVPHGTAGRRRPRRSSPVDAEPMADWAWVEEWRRGGEPTPWGPGLFLATFAGLIIGCAVYVISTGLADILWLALVANVVVAAGLTPALWMSRSLPVLRWVGLGGAAGTVVAWISLLFFPHF